MGSQRLQEAEMAVLLREVLSGLAYLHADGKIHRDIKGTRRRLLFIPFIRLFFCFVYSFVLFSSACSKLLGVRRLAKAEAEARSRRRAELT